MVTKIISTLVTNIDLKGITRCKLAVIFEPANHRKFLACFRPPQTFYRFIFLYFLTSIYTNLWHGRGGRTYGTVWKKLPCLESSRLHLVIPFKSMVTNVNKIEISKSWIFFFNSNLICEMLNVLHPGNFFSNFEKAEKQSNKSVKSMTVLCFSLSKSFESKS